MYLTFIRKVYYNNVIKTTHSLFRHFSVCITLQFKKYIKLYIDTTVLIGNDSTVCLEYTYSEM